ncbi:MAG: DUF2919 domain-containing protein [Gammaproteobacteria bacterium]|nr:DUF2919 domain-containing protein [Gammaproteobacteria bacterium]
MKYNPFTHYDKHGSLKLPFGLYVSLFFLLKSYLVWIAALSFRQDTARLLSLFYPDSPSFIAALIISLPALMLLVVVSIRRVNMPLWVEKICRVIPNLLFVSGVIQLLFHLSMLTKIHRLTPMVTIWIVLVELSMLVAIVFYSLYSQHLKDAAQQFPKDAEG